MSFLFDKRTKKSINIVWSVIAMLVTSEWSFSSRQVLRIGSRSERQYEYFQPRTVRT